MVRVGFALSPTVTTTVYSDISDLYYLPRGEMVITVDLSCCATNAASSMVEEDNVWRRGGGRVLENHP